MSRTQHPSDEQPALRAQPMPADANVNGDIFGGWLLSQMDLAAWICARKKTPHRLVTVSLDGVVFHKPVYVGDCLLCYATVERIGRTSITIHVTAHAERAKGGEDVTVTEGRFTLVALDENREPVPIQG